jgi:hypothetical protein
MKHLLRAALGRLAPVLAALCLPAILSATTVVPPEFPTLVNDSDYIIRAVTRNVTTLKQPGLHGGRIFTRVELDIVEVIAGTPPANVVLEFLGGRLGDEQLKIEGMPEFKVGDEDILFVSGNGHTICPLYAMMHGRYPVQADAATGKKFVARADHSPLHSTAEIGTPIAENSAPGLARAAAVAPLDPASFIQQIRATVTPDARLNRAK